MFQNQLWYNRRFLTRFVTIQTYPVLFYHAAGKDELTIIKFNLKTQRRKSHLSSQQLIPHNGIFYYFFYFYNFHGFIFNQIILEYFGLNCRINTVTSRLFLKRDWTLFSNYHVNTTTTLYWRFTTDTVV